MSMKNIDRVRRELTMVIQRMETLRRTSMHRIRAVATSLVPSARWPTIFERPLS